VSERGRHEQLLVVLGSVIAIWGIFLFFQSAYFGAGFYGVPVPSWAMWVGNLPIWTFNAVDTVMIAVLITSLLVAYYSSPKHRRATRSSRGTSSIGGLVLLLVGLFLIFAFLFALGFNLAGLWTDFKGFFGGL
jgi:hypothetical protein